LEEAFILRGLSKHNSVPLSQHYQRADKGNNQDRERQKFHNEVLKHDGRLFVHLSQLGS
jgi:hypothetical protein